MNGTFVNNSSIRLSKGERVELKSGDEIYLLNPKYIKPNSHNSSTHFMFVNVSERLFDKKEFVTTNTTTTNTNTTTANTTTTNTNSLPRIEDEYIVGDLLGVGTSGRVHVCVERATRAQRAVKIIDTRKFALTPGLSLQELREEAEMIRRLNHVRGGDGDDDDEGGGGDD